MTLRASTARLLRATIGTLGLAAVVGCYSSGQGNTPDDRQLYFPVGLAVSRGGNFLFVVNSDFDLKYNAGTLAALDLPAIRGAVKGCEEATNKRAVAGCALASGGPPSNTSDFVRHSVHIGAFAADITSIPTYAGLPRPEGAGAGPTPLANVGRLLIPVRGDATLTYVDYDETSGLVLKCGPGLQQPAGFGQSCSSDHRIGNDTSSNSRQIGLEGEPFSIATPAYWPADDTYAPRSSGGIAAVVHQQTGDVSIFVNTHLDQAVPKLAFTLNGLPAGATSIAPLDVVSKDDKGSDLRFAPRFLVTNRTQPSLYVVTYFPDPQVDRSYLAVSDIVRINTNSSGFDSRGVVADPPNPAPCPDATKCVAEDRPTRIFLTNRSPSTLISGEFDRVSGRLSFFENVPVPIGPARLMRVPYETKAPDGRRVIRTRIYVACFDARSVVGYDPTRRIVTNVIRVGRGAYAMAYDPIGKLGFVTSFTDSTVHVIELDPAKDLFEQLVFIIGLPTPPKS